VIDETVQKKNKISSTLIESFRESEVAKQWTIS